jgi:hypothetical protein
MSSNDKPTAAFVLSLIGGIFIVLGGIVEAAIGSFFTLFSFGLTGAVVVLGVVGIILGVVIIAGSAQINSNPERSHVTWGAIILVISIVSIFAGMGGFFIGFILALIGGILAIVWKP